MAAPMTVILGMALCAKALVMACGAWLYKKTQKTRA
jgi:hypothetical protein